MDKVTPTIDIFKANLDRAAPLLAKLKSGGEPHDGPGGGDYSFDFYMETRHVSLARGTHKIQRLGV
jgi:hypothetical protein